MAARAQVVVVLVRTRNPLNMGAAARAMANFGFARLRVVAPYEAASREARSAVGAAAVMRSRGGVRDRSGGGGGLRAGGGDHGAPRA
jgi:tRNA C32,U32 (ribose-2'-O)-methylase TrmJ